MKKIIIVSLVLTIFLSGCSLFKSEVKKEPLPKSNVAYFQPVDRESKYFNKDLVPAGSLVLSCGSYLTLKSFGTVTYVSEPQFLEFIVASLLSFQPEGGSMYFNPLFEMGIRLESLEVVDEKTIISLQGDFKDLGTCKNAQAKMMVEESIKKYNNNYEIRLNGSAEEWRCLYDKDCK